MLGREIKKLLFFSVVVMVILIFFYLTFKMFSNNLGYEDIHEYCSLSANEGDNTSLSNSDWNKTYHACLKKHGLEDDI